MSSSGWTLPAIITVIIGFGLFGVYSYVDPTYGVTNVRNAPQPVVPVLSPGDERVSSVQQPGDTSASTPLPSLAEPPSSGVTRLPIDPWMSEVMETTLRGSLVEEPKEPDEAVEGEGLLRDASGESTSHPGGLVAPEVGSRSFETPFSENTVAYYQDRAQPSTEQYTYAAPQQAATPAPPGSPTGTETPSPPPTDASVSWGGDAGEVSDEPKRILIVEDPRVLGEDLATVLNHQLGLEVVGRTSSAAGCRDFVAGDQGFDVSVVDLFLADDQATHLIEELHEACSQAPMLVLIEGADPRDHERAIRAGADAVLGKGADPEEILSAVRRLSLG
jgi:CheY-like chemotaxis protein